MMTGNTFMIGGCFDVEEGTFFEIAGIDQNVAGARAVWGGWKYWAPGAPC